VTRTQGSRCASASAAAACEPARKRAFAQISAWIASGATHHNALAPGRLDVELEVVARALGIRSVRV